MLNRTLRMTYLLSFLFSFQLYAIELKYNFESSFGDFTNVGEYSYSRHSGTTPSGETGPSSGANGTTYYAYLETSRGSAFTTGDQGILQINDVEAKRLSFYYHMYGADMGRLEVEVYFNNVWHLLTFLSGQRQTSTTADWTRLNLDLSNYPGKVNIRFVGEARGGYRGDMAIDEITIDEQPNTLINFETNLGGMVNTGSYNLSRDSGGTSSGGTGPSSGANGTNYYTYFETSSGSANSANNTGMLEYDRVDADVMRFHYHMYGADIGTLAVDKYTVNGWERAWGKTGQQHASTTDLWTQVYVDVKGATKLRFVTTASGGYKGDIAIDEIEFEPADYYNHSPNFDTGLRWTNTGIYDWSLQSGATSSGGTGPSSGQGYNPYSVSTYAYVETSSGSAYYAGNTAILESPYYENGDFVQFYYSMIGADIGALYLEGKNSAGNWVIIWSKNGPQTTSAGTDWTKAEVDISTYNSSYTQIRFRAVAAGGYRGDIAIDSVRMFFNGGDEGFTYEGDPEPYQAGDGVDYWFCASDNDGVANMSYRLAGTTQWIESSGYMHCSTVNLGELPTGGHTIETRYVDDLGNVYFSSDYFVVELIGDNNSGEIPINIENPAAPTQTVLGLEDPLSTTVGTLGGQFRVDESGAATYTLPIAVPSGISGIAPQLALSYSSSAGNGAMGMGWNIAGSSSISRCRKTHEEDLASAAITLTTIDPLCLDGQRLRSLPQSDNGLHNSEYRTVLDNQKRITGTGNSTSSTSFFEVEHPDGSVHTYEPGLLITDSLIPVNWLLAKITDNMGNEIQFSYNESDNITGELGDNEFALTSISYSGNTIAYKYSTNRLNQFSGFAFGENLSSKSKLDSVEVSNQNQMLHTYGISYYPDSYSAFNMVEGIKKCAGVSFTICHEATSFDWNNAASSSNFSYKAVRTLGNDPATQLVPIDIDGNGLSDIIYTTDSGANYELYVAYNNGAYFDAPILLTSISSPGNDFKLLPSDIDGDGLVELVYPSNEKWLYYDFDETNARQVSSQRFDYSYESSVFDTGLSYDETGKNVHLADTTGDALPDFLSEHLGFFVNSKQGFTQSKVGKTIDVSSLKDDFPPACRDLNFTVSPDTSRRPRTLFDFNGDGRTDSLIHISTGGGRGPCANGFTVPAIVTGENELSYKAYGRAFSSGEIGSGSNVLKIPADINSDGLSDIVVFGNSVKVSINNGLGFDYLQVIDIDEPNPYSRFPVKQEQVQSFTINDINSDGRPDIFYFFKSTKTWYAHYQNENGVFAREPVAISNALSSFDEDRDFTMVADWDGDGKLGFAWVRGEDKKVQVYSDGLSNAQPNYTLSKISNGFGIATDVVYASLIDDDIYTKGVGAELLTNYGAGSPVYEIISSSHVVSSVTSDAPSSANASARVSVEYQYEAMRAQASGRGMLGFEKIRTYDIQTDVTTETVYRQDYPHIGMPIETRRYLGKYLDWDTLVNTQKLSFASNIYATQLLNGGDTIYPYLDTSTETQYNLNDAGTSTSKISTVVTHNDYDLVGVNHVNLVKVTVTTKNAYNAVVSTITTKNVYVDNIPKWWLGRVTSTEVRHNRSNDFPNADITRTSTFEYHTSGIHEGMLELAHIEPSEGADKALSTLYCYDSVGNRTGTVTYSRPYNDLSSCDAAAPADVKDNPTHIYRRSLKELDDEQRYVTAAGNDLFNFASDNPLSEVTDRNTLGQPTETIDINDVIATVAYDSFGRQFASSNNLGGLTMSTRRLQSDAWAGTPSVGVGYYFVERTTGNGQPTTYGYFDKVGRQVAGVKQDFKTNEWIHQYSRYDEYGRTVQQSIPKKSSSTEAVSPDWSTTEYDKFGRAQSITTADGTYNRIHYDGLTTQTVTATNDAFGVTQTRSETKGLLGNTASVTDDAGTITYEYNATGNLTKVTGFNNVTVTTKFDDLGRKYEMNDPDKGIWKYTYNALGELATQTSANGHTTAYYRDSVGRTVKRTVAANDAVFEYTMFAFAGHRLTNTCQTNSAGTCLSAQSKKAYGYDDFGRPSLVTTTLDGRQFTQQTIYDEYGRVFQQFDAEENNSLGCVFNNSAMAGAACRGLKFNYTNTGYLFSQEEARTSGGSDSVVYYQVDDIDAFGNVVKFTQNANQAGALQTTKGFDPQTGYLANLKTENSRGEKLVNHTYAFDAIGNLHQRANLSSGYTENFGYDTVNRLETATGSPIRNISVTYDDNGNILTKSDLQNGATYGYGAKPNRCSASANVSAGPHAVTSVGSLSYCYDKHGNQTQAYDGNTQTRAIDYSHFDKPTLINNMQGNASTAFAYDNGRNRFKRLDVKGGDTTTTYYVGNLEFVSKSDGSSEIRRYLPSAIETIIGSSKTLRYLHKDHLGSIDTITNASGKIEDKLYFDAWGNKHRLTVTSSWGLDAQANKASMLSDILNATPRGYTGHEHIDHANIIHINGRIYDPTLGRFLQADPFIQGPRNSQSYNRYSYVLNNPLSYTDPSGYFFNKLFKGLNKAFGKFAPFVGLALMFIPGVGQWAAASMWNAAAIGFVSGGIATGSLKGALIGAFSAAAFQQIGQHFRGLSNSNIDRWNTASGAQANTIMDGLNTFGGLELTSGQIAGQIASHAAAGGVISTLSGGKFGHGFFSAGFTKGVGTSVNAQYGSGPISGTLSNMVIGGTTSVISGGKFANGAKTAAYQSLFNEFSDWFRRTNHSTPSRGNRPFQTAEGVLAEQSGAESITDFNTTTLKKVAKALGYVGTALATAGTAGGSLVVQGVGVIVLGGACSLDPSPQNLISVATGPLGKGAGYFYKPLGEVIENIGYVNDAITIACDIPLKC